jgi:hypothetical protein
VAPESRQSQKQQQRQISDIVKIEIQEQREPSLKSIHSLRLTDSKKSIRQVSNKLEKFDVQEVAPNVG